MKMRMMRIAAISVASDQKMGVEFFLDIFKGRTELVSPFCLEKFPAAVVIF